MEQIIYRLCNCTYTYTVTFDTIPQVDEDQPTSFSEFKLEYCCGTVCCPDNQKSEFIKAYQGPHMGYTLRHLKPFMYYSVRVCGRVEDSTPWCVWSVPAVGMTRLQPYGQYKVIYKKSLLSLSSLMWYE